MGPFYFDGAHRIEERDGESMLDGRPLGFGDFVFVQAPGGTWHFGEIDFDIVDGPPLFRDFEGDTDDAVAIPATHRIRWARKTNGVYCPPTAPAIELPIVEAVTRVVHDYIEGRTWIRANGEDRIEPCPAVRDSPIATATAFNDKIDGVWLRAPRLPVEIESDLPPASIAVIHFEGAFTECVHMEDILESLRISRERRESEVRDAEADARHLEREESYRRGHIYVIGFSTGTIKVGQSRTPDKRVATHVADAARFGVTIERTWISPSTEAFRECERELIGRCSDVTPPHAGKEYFRVDFDHAVSIARQLVTKIKPRKRQPVSMDGLKTLLFGSEDPLDSKGGRARAALEARAQHRIRILKAVG